MFKNVKSNYLLKNIFSYINDRKLLRIIKYNKKIQKRIGFTKKNFENYFNIKFEIIPIDCIDFDNNLINCKIDCVNYAKINGKYLNLKKKGIFVPTEEKVEIIELSINTIDISLEGLFQNCLYIKEISFIGFKRDNFRDFGGMFQDCYNLEKINFHEFKSYEVIDMSYMFCGCKKIRNLDLSKFNTSNVLNMEYMFFCCSNLVKINLSSFDTSKVQNMCYMFGYCEKFNKLLLPNLSGNNLQLAKGMFCYCSELKTIELENFSTKGVINMEKMFFFFCSSLSLIKIKQFMITHDTRTNEIFENCPKSLLIYSGGTILYKNYFS